MVSWGNARLNTFTLAPLCNGSEIAAGLSTYTLSTGTVFKQNTDVRFLGLSRGVQLTSGTTQTFDIGNAQSPGFKYSVRVSRSGEIYEVGISAM
jgi:hypothetical protein